MMLPSMYMLSSLLLPNITTLVCKQQKTTDTFHSFSMLKWRKSLKTFMSIFLDKQMEGWDCLQVQLPLYFKSRPILDNNAFYHKVEGTGWIHLKSHSALSLNLTCPIVHGAGRLGVRWQPYQGTQKHLSVHSLLSRGNWQTNLILSEILKRDK